MFLEETGDGHRGEHCGGQGQVGVDGCSMLPVSVVCDGRVEAGPEHPQEERAWAESKRTSCVSSALPWQQSVAEPFKMRRQLPTDHSKDIRVIHGSLQAAALVQVWPIEHP